MAKSLKQWLREDVFRLQKKSIEYLSNFYFFRDPVRTQLIDQDHFYSPADGIILYQKVVQNVDDPIIEIKGINYTLRDVLSDPDYNKPALVIGIFMSFYDVHINRIPYGGVLSFISLDTVESYNIPMLATEHDILNKVINPDNMGYLKNNERMWNKIYIPILDYTYYVVQIADEDVNVIAHFVEQNEILSQNERFSFIRWGSQCELILPLDDRFEFELCQPDAYHVEAGIDKLVKIIQK
jgi:phosphatidylserine decarboxylase